MNNKTNKINKYLLALIGLFLVSYFIWFRFIRERLPRDISFEQSYITLIILFIVCLIYIYIILRLLKPKTPSKFILNLLVRIQKLYKPFLILDEMLQNNFIFSFIINKNLLFFNYFIKKYELYLIKSQNKFFLVFNTLPRITLCIIFSLDVLWYHKINYFIIWLGVMPLIFKYLLYVININTKKKIEYLNTNFYTIPLKINKNESDDEGYLFSLDNVLNIHGFMNTKLFIELQADSLLLLCDLYNYDCVETIEAREKFAKKYNINLPPIYLAEPRNDEVSIALSKEYFKWMPIVINISSFFSLQHVYKEKTKNMQNKVTIIILIMYLICWLYILFTTLCTLNSEIWFNILEVLKEILENIEEPFSLIKIEEAINNYEQQYK